MKISHRLKLPCALNPSCCCVKDRRGEWNKGARANYTPILEDYHCLCFGVTDR